MQSESSKRLSYTVILSLIVLVFIGDDAEARRRRGGFRSSKQFQSFRQSQFNPRSRSGCNQFFCRNTNVIQDRNNFADRFDGFSEIADFEQVPGFPNLLKKGNALFERTLTPDGNVRIRDLQIINGRVFGATDPIKTGKQLEEFYLRNLDKFGLDLDLVCFGQSVGFRRNHTRNHTGNAQLVSDFLRQSGACNPIVDTVTVELDTHGLEKLPGYAGMTAAEIGRRILNMLLNSVTNSAQILKINAGDVRADGTVQLPNLRRFLRSDALALAFRDNPFTKCGQPIPLQWLAERLMNPEIYYRLLGIPEKKTELGERLGVFTDKTQTKANKILVYTPPETKAKGKKESVPGLADERILERQPQQGDVSGKVNNVNLGRLGGAFYASWDFIDDPAAGSDQNARSVFKSGILATEDASEMLWSLPNGFMGAALFNGQGIRQNAAPKNVAVGGALDGTISPLGACLDCHRDGFNGGGVIRNNANSPERYTDVFAANSPHPKVDSFSRQFFMNGGNPEYEALKIRDNSDLVARHELAEARIVNDGKTQAGITDAMVAYRKVLSAEDQERELKVAPGSRAGVGAMTRRAFDDAYCGLKGLRPTQDIGRLNFSDSLRSGGGRNDVTQTIRNQNSRIQSGGRHNRFRR